MIAEAGTPTGGRRCFSFGASREATMIDHPTYFDLQADERRERRFALLEGPQQGRRRLICPERPCVIAGE
jgi:hypothetical protein